MELSGFLVRLRHLAAHFPLFKLSGQPPQAAKVQRPLPLPIEPMDDEVILVPIPILRAPIIGDEPRGVANER